MAKYQKHTNLSRRKNGVFAPNEISILGAKCSVISDLVFQVSKRISNYNFAYFDASHAKNVEENLLTDFTFHHDGNLNITTSSPVNKYVQRIQFTQFDFVFINGNHYPGEKQIVFLDPEKEASINKRIEQISEVQFFVKLIQEIEPFQSLKDTFPGEKFLVTILMKLKKLPIIFLKLYQKPFQIVKDWFLLEEKVLEWGKINRN